jgi:hypothetical protein
MPKKEKTLTFKPTQNEIVVGWLTSSWMIVLHPKRD